MKALRTGYVAYEVDGRVKVLEVRVQSESRTAITLTAPCPALKHARRCPKAEIKDTREEALQIMQERLIAEINQHEKRLSAIASMTGDINEELNRWARGGTR